MKATGIKVLRLSLLLLMLGVAVWLTVPALTGPNRGPSFATQRKEQRKVCQERVQAAGGWEALRKDCESLLTNASQGYFEWHPPITNAHVTHYSNSVPSSQYVTNIDYGPLPPTVASLRPKEVEFIVPTNGPIVVRIKLFGMGRSGMRDIPYYGLWVVCGTTPNDFVPSIDERPHGGINKLADSVFEVYQISR
jgi:hypothetical protein